MQVRILGPFQLEDGGRQITVGGVRQRAVLADLVLNANEVVPSEQLLLDLWGEESPPSAANALQAAISRLRRLLPPGRLITAAPGYALRIFPAELDVKQFEQLISDGREALVARVPAEAARTLDQALTFWRGPPLADFRYEPFAQAEIARLEELRVACLEERMASSCWPSTAAGGRPRRWRSTATSGTPCAKNSVWNRCRRSVNSKPQSCATIRCFHPGRPPPHLHWRADR